jgi:uncharacterized protein YoxC
MSVTLLVTLTVLEILALVIVLAIFLVKITRHLRSTADTLAKVTFGVRAVESQVGVVGPGVTKVNQTLEEIVGALPGIAGKAENIASRS